MGQNGYPGGASGPNGSDNGYARGTAPGQQGQVNTENSNGYPRGGPGQGADQSAGENGYSNGAASIGSLGLQNSADNVNGYPSGGPQLNNAGRRPGGTNGYTGGSQQGNVVAGASDENGYPSGGPQQNNINGVNSPNNGGNGYRNGSSQGGNEQGNNFGANSGNNTPLIGGADGYPSGGPAVRGSGY